MRGNHDLFDLIRSLTPSEKRHFKLYCNLQEGEKHYLRLFDALQNLPEYHEKDLKKSLTGDPVVKHWAFNKKYLYDKIIESLGMIKLKDDVDLQISDLIRTYKILRNKGLYPQAMRYLSMAKKKARANDLYARLYDILTMEYNERAFSQSKVIDPKITSIMEERKSVLKVIENYSWIGDIFIKLETWVRLHDVAITDTHFKEINAIIAPLLPLQKEHAICNESRHFYMMALAKYHQACGNPDKAWHLLHEKPDENLPSTHWKTTAISVYLLTALRSYAESNNDNLLNWLLQASGKNAYGHSAFEQWLYIKLSTLCTKGEFECARKIVDEELPAKCTEAETSMSKWGRLSIYYMIAYTYFGSGELDKASKWCQKVLDSDETDVIVYYYTRVLHLIILFEKGDHDLFEYKLRSFERYVKLKRPECALLGLGKLFYLLHSKVEKDKLKLREVADHLLEDLQAIAYSNMLFHLDMVAWIHCKTGNLPFCESVKRRYGNMSRQGNPERALKKTAYFSHELINRRVA